jgi:non-homologous end joining protein Ku
MIKLAEHILDTKAAHFDPKKFSDRYETALRKLVKRKASGKKIEEPESEDKPSNVVNLMEALRRSVGGGKRSSRPRAASRKRSLSSRRRKKAA